MEWIETTGSTVDEAKDRALDRLGIAEDDMQFEIIDEGSSSVFRLKRKEARLRARVKPVSTRSKTPDRRSRNTKKSKNNKNDKSGSVRNKNNNNSKKAESKGKTTKNINNKPDKNETKTGKKRDNNTKSSKKGTSNSNSVSNNKASVEEKKDKMDLEEQAEITEDFVSGLLEKMGLQARVVSSIEDNRAIVQAQGLNLGLAIGPRGETVRAITQLSHTMIQRLSDGEAEGKLTVDIGGYRERRRTFLAEFAVNQANDVLDGGHSIALDPMNASDRKVVHDAISELEGVTTRSEGSDYDRHVVIFVDDAV